MTDQEASKRLFDLCGWRLQPCTVGVFLLLDRTGKRLDNLHDKSVIGINGIPNLYAPNNMYLAWEVVRWRANTCFFDDVTVDAQAKQEFNRMLLYSQDLPAIEAQRLWLNTVHSLGVEAGMI